MQWIPSEKKEQQEQEPKQRPVVFFKTDNGWRKEEFEKTLVKKVPLDTTPPEPKPHVWFDFSNVPLDATSPQPKPEQDPVAWEVQAQLRPLYIDGADLSLDVVEQIHQWARQCVTDEREACAKTVEQAGIDGFGTLAAAAVIRKRGNDA